MAPTLPPDNPSRLWFVGLTTLDVIHRGAAPTHRNQKVTANWQGVSAGGPAANAAVVAAALGAQVTLFTALGTSPAAAVARADLEQHGVQVFDLADDDFQLAVSAILVDEATSERSVVSLDGGRWARRDFPTLEAVFDSVRHPQVSAEPQRLTKPPALADKTPNAVLFDGHHPHLARWLANELTQIEPRPLVILDGGRWRPIFADLIPIADVAALSADFAVPGIGSNSSQIQALGAKAAVVTHGPGSVEWATSAESGCVPVPQVPAVDTLGAGDAFHGALTYYLASGNELPTAIAQANQIAATKVQHLGNRDWLTQLVDVGLG